MNINKTYTAIALSLGAIASAHASVIQTGAGGTTTPTLDTPNSISITLDQSAFTSANLWDSGTSTVGGGAVSGSLFIAFEMTPLDRGGNPNISNASSGARLSGGGSDIVFGNRLSAWAYSAWKGTNDNLGDISEGAGRIDPVKGTTVLGVMEFNFGSAVDDTLVLKVSGDDGATWSTRTFTGDYSFDGFNFESNYTSGDPNGWKWSTAGFATTQAEAIAIVPEPSSAALLGLGGLALILRRRK